MCERRVPLLQRRSFSVPPCSARRSLAPTRQASPLSLPLGYQRGRKAPTNCLALGKPYTLWGWRAIVLLFVCALPGGCSSFVSPPTRHGVGAAAEVNVNIVCGSHRVVSVSPSENQDNRFRSSRCRYRNGIDRHTARPSPPRCKIGMYR